MVGINQVRKYLIFFLSIGLVLLLGIGFWNSYPVQNLVGRFKMETDSKIEEHLKQELKNKSDRELVRLLQGGDYGKAHIAKYFLAQRANPELFDDVAKLLKNQNQEVRIRARALLWSLDQQRALNVYISELKNLSKDSYEYTQVLSVLCARKYQPAFPYLTEYAHRENGWKTAVADYFVELGNPDAIPVLKEMLSKVPNDNKISTSINRERIVKAIKTLEAVSAQEIQ